MSQKHVSSYSKVLKSRTDIKQGRKENKCRTYVVCVYIPGIRRRAVLFHFRSRSRILDAAELKVMATWEVLKRYDG